MGFKLAGLLSMVLFGMTVYVANSFAVSKLALALGIGMILAKFLYKSIDHGKYDIEIYPSQIHNQYPSGKVNFFVNEEVFGKRNFIIFFSIFNILLQRWLLSLSILSV